MPRESKEEKKKRAATVVTRLKKMYPDAKCSLNFSTVHQLMVATILSAQCTDERVNLTTPALFKKYTSIKSFADADVNELGQDIRQTGFFNSKAKSIKKSAQQLLDEHDGKIPKTITELTKLAGVGRKTASVILGVGYGIEEGVVVDTHVGRISRLLGFTKETDPVKVERDLMELVAKKDWIIYSHLMIYHGRAICKARKPDCPHCKLNDICPSSTV